MTFIPAPQEIYRHFKGNLYQIVTIAEDSETGKQLVIYQAMYGDFKTYARDLDMFISRVDRAKYPDVTQEFRFELQGPGKDRQKRECPAAAEVPAKEVQAPVEKTQEPVMTVPAGEKQEAAVLTETAEKKQETVALTENMKAAEPVQVQSVQSAKEMVQEEAPAQQGAEALEDAGLDPMLVQFLDADTYEEKLNILAGLHHRITQDMITIMAVSSDIEVEDGELEDRYQQLRTCLITLEKYECRRQ